jgi:hypothetical protein
VVGEVGVRVGEDDFLPIVLAVLEMGWIWCGDGDGEMQWWWAPDMVRSEV